MLPPVEFEIYLTPEANRGSANRLRPITKSKIPMAQNTDSVKSHCVPKAPNLPSTTIVTTREKA